VRRDVSSLWRFSATVWLTGMLTYALGKQTDIFTMQILRTPQADIGFYNLAVTLAISANAILLAGISNVALSGLASLRAKAPEKLGKGWRTLCSVGPLLSVPVLVFTGVFAGPIVTALYGSAYDDAATILEIYIGFVIAGQILGGGAHTTAFAALGIPRRTLQSRGVTGVANLVINIPLIYFWGAIGAVLGTGVCGVVTIYYEYRLLTRHIVERLPWADRGRAALAMIPGLIPAWFIAPHLGILGVLIAGAVFLGSYAALLTWLKPLELDSDVLGAVPMAARRFVRVRRVPADAGAVTAEPAL
jgi:O-antigen/teichoic acid export membrane protein